MPVRCVRGRVDGARCFGERRSSRGFEFIRHGGKLWLSWGSGRWAGRSEDLPRRTTVAPHPGIPRRVTLPCCHASVSPDEEQGTATAMASQGVGRQCHERASYDQDGIGHDPFHPPVVHQRGMGKFQETAVAGQRPSRRSTDPPSSVLTLRGTTRSPCTLLTPGTQPSDNSEGGSEPTTKA